MLAATNPDGRSTSSASLERAALAPAFPFRALALGILVTTALVGCGGFGIWRLYGGLHRIVRTELRAHTLAASMLRLEAEMTSSAHLAVVTGDLAWRDAHERSEARLRGAIDESMALGLDRDIDGLVAARAAIDQLADMNSRHLDSTASGDAAIAQRMLRSDEYAAVQDQFIIAIEKSTEAIDRRATDALEHHRWLAILDSILAGILFVLLAFLWRRIWISIVGYMRVAREAQRELADANQELEARVERRTEQLRQEMTARSRIEVDLRQAQKLESVGRLAAGIAHEINTPVQFVSDSCTFVRDSMIDMERAVARYQEILARCAASSSPGTALAEAEETERETDLDYLREQVPLALTRALDGLARIATIVRAMKGFAHPEQTEMAPGDLNRAIEDTLTIARHEYKSVADVQTSFGSIPPVTCHLGEVNQVVLNLIVNAAHAIEDKVRGSAARGTITVKTWQEGASACISVEDTGTGIPDDVRQKIFEPFFTTKEVGRGTGQGLAMAHNIVTKHCGSIQVDSAVGHGTTFTIRIPIEQVSMAQAA